MQIQGKFFAAGLAVILFALPAQAGPAYAGIVDAFKESWSEVRQSSKGKKVSPEASRKMNTGAAGCMEALLDAKARGADGASMSAACAQGANQKIQEEEARAAQEEQELLARKDAATFGRRIEHVNERIVERQPRIERIIAEKKGDAPPVTEDTVVMDKKCRADAACRETVLEAEREASNPGFFRRVWYWMFPGSAPKAKAELKGIERDIAFLERSIQDIKAGIEDIESSIYTATSVKQKSALARDKGELISQFSQCNQALAVLKEQQSTLDKGYFAYVLMVFAAIGGTIVKKLSDGAVNTGLDGVKHVVSRVRRKKDPKKEHKMY